MIAPPDMIVTIDDIRRAGHCPAGARSWFACRGLDFRAFIKNKGCPAAELLAVEDNGLAVQVIQRKMEREHG